MNQSTCHVKEVRAKLHVHDFEIFLLAALLGDAASFSDIQASMSVRRSMMTLASASLGRRNYDVEEHPDLNWGCCGLLGL